MTASKVKRWGCRYLCSYHGSKLKSIGSSHKPNIFEAKLREFPQDERETIKSLIVSYAEKLVLEGKKSKFIVNDMEVKIFLETCKHSF